MSGLPARARWASFLRSFAIQGSWNYRTMLGGGFAFALLPVLRRLFPDEAELREAVRRHAQHFNAHPYLSGIALGATARLEEEGEDPELIRRFKMAVRGPLGGVGDRLFWSGWLPVSALLGLLAALTPAPPWVAVAIFLVVYNTGHLGFRIWGYRVGYAEGRQVAERLRHAGLAHRAEGVLSTGTLLLGALTGLLAVRALTGGAFDPSSLTWLAGAVAAFAAGAGLGQAVWRPAVYLLMSGLAAVLVLGRFWP